MLGCGISTLFLSAPLQRLATLVGVVFDSWTRGKLQCYRSTCRRQLPAWRKQKNVLFFPFWNLYYPEMGIFQVCSPLLSRLHATVVPVTALATHVRWRNCQRSHNDFQVTPRPLADLTPPENPMVAAHSMMCPCPRRPKNRIFPIWFRAQWGRFNDYFSNRCLIYFFIVWSKCLAKGYYRHSLDQELKWC